MSSFWIGFIVGAVSIIIIAFVAFYYMFRNFGRGWF